MALVVASGAPCSIVGAPCSVVGTSECAGVCTARGAMCRRTGDSTVYGTLILSALTSVVVVSVNVSIAIAIIIIMPWC